MANTETTLGQLKSGEVFIFGGIVFKAGQMQVTSKPEQLRCCHISNTDFIVFISATAWIERVRG